MKCWETVFVQCDHFCKSVYALKNSLYVYTLKNLDLATDSAKDFAWLRANQNVLSSCHVLSESKVSLKFPFFIFQFVIFMWGIPGFKVTFPTCCHLLIFNSAFTGVCELCLPLPFPPFSSLLPTIVLTYPQFFLKNKYWSCYNAVPSNIIKQYDF